MKRTIEITFTAIGLAFNLLGAIGFILLTSLSKQDLFMESFEEGFNEGLAEEGMENTMEAGMFLNAITGFGWFLSILSIIGVLIGILAIFFFVGNRKPKAASILLIVTSVIILLGTVGFGFLAFLCYIIAGIVGLVRKPPVVEEEKTIHVT